jgi:nicotinamide-nucleotide amidase
VSASELKRLLTAQPNLTVAVAESLTCGHLQALIGSVSGSSGYFLGGVTAYTLDAKAQLLGVSAEEARPVNAVSAAVAEQMAAGVCRLFGSSFGVSTTGYAEPSPADGAVEPFAWWGFCDARGGGEQRAIVRSGRVTLPGLARVEVQRRVAERALDELVRYLQATL